MEGGGEAGAPLYDPASGAPPSSTAESKHANLSQIMQIAVLSVFCSLL